MEYSNSSVGSKTGLCSSLNCKSGEIIVDVCPGNTAPTSALNFEITYPDGTNSTVNSTLPLAFDFTSDGPYTISVDTGKKGFQVIDTIVVNCASVLNPCDSIANISSCVLTLNKRYEELKCRNDKTANIEKIKLDRVMQLLKLAEYDCECGNGLVKNYIDEINNIANCNNCDIDYSIINAAALGCTDPNANNYDSSATVDNGSCLYAQKCVSVTMPNRAPWNGSSQSETLVPDPLFEAFLEAQGMGNGILDGKVCTDNINQSAIFTCSGHTINDATGIGDMVNFPLRILNFTDNNLSSIDISYNIDLVSVKIRDNNLSTLNTSTNTSLQNISVKNNNSLSSLDLTNNINLTALDATSCNLSSLDVSMCTGLEFLHLSNNSNLATLNLGENINLTVLMSGTNPGRNGNLNFTLELAKSNLNIKVGTSARVTQATTLLNNLLTDGSAPNGAFTGYTITT